MRLGDPGVIRTRDPQIRNLTTHTEFTHTLPVSPSDTSTELSSNSRPEVSGAPPAQSITNPAGAAGFHSRMLKSGCFQRSASGHCGHQGGRTPSSALCQ